MRSPIFLSLIAALPLLACRPAADRAAGENAVTAETAAPAAPATPRGRRAPDDDPIERGANLSVSAGTDGGTADNASSAIPGKAGIPKPFQGRWALVPADCTSTRGDAKGLLIVEGSGLRFFESRATIDRIESNVPPTRLVASFDFTGEGMTWKRVMTLERSGNRLRRIERGGEEGPVDLTYTACPA